MAEVLDERQYAEWKGEVVCAKRDQFDRIEGCGVTIQFGRDDLAPMYHLGDYGGRHHYAAVQCPNCKKYVYAGRDVPRPIICWVLSAEKIENAKFDGVRGVI